MSKKLLGLLAVGLACGSMAAKGTPTLVGSTDNASGVDGVVVNSITYNVSFSVSSYDATFTSGADQLAAATSLSAALNLLSVTGLSYGGSSGFACAPASGASTQCDIYTGPLGSTLVADNYQGSGGWGTNNFAQQLGCPYSYLGTSFCSEAAQWTAVPEPGTIMLLSLGLTGLGLSRKRKSA